MIAIIQYNRNFYTQYIDENINKDDIQEDVTNLNNILFCGQGGSEIMDFNKRNIPLIYKNEIASECYIGEDGLYTNITKELHRFNINNLYNKIINNNYTIAPFRLTIIPTGELFLLSPRMIFGECLSSNVNESNKDYIDISYNNDNTEFLHYIEPGDNLLINNKKYTCIDVTSIYNGKRIFIYPEIEDLNNFIVFNIDKFKRKNIYYNKTTNNGIVSSLKILFIDNSTGYSPEFYLDRIDNYTNLYINNDIYQKLYNIIFNKYIQLVEFWNNIYNKIEKHILINMINKGDNWINISGINNIRIGDYLVCKWSDQTGSFERVLKVKIKESNRIYVEQNNDVDIPINAEVYRSLSYYFLLFVYNNLSNIDINTNKIIQKLEYS